MKRHLFSFLPAILVFWVSSSWTATPSPTPVIRRTAAVVGVTGRVTVRSGGAVRDAGPGMVLGQGDTVVLARKDSFASIRMDDGSRIRLAGVTRVRFQELTRGEGKNVVTRLRLLTGKIWAKVKKLRTKDSVFEIKAGGVVCGVRGTTLAGQRSADGTKGAFYNLSGKVFVSDGKREMLLKKGKGAAFADGLLGDVIDIPDDMRGLDNAGDFGGAGGAIGGAFGGAKGAGLGQMLGGGLSGGIDAEREGGGPMGGLASDLGGGLGDLMDSAHDTDSNMTNVQSDEVHAIDILFDSPENGYPIGVGY